MRIATTNPRSHPVIVGRAAPVQLLISPAAPTGVPHPSPVLRRVGGRPNSPKPIHPLSAHWASMPIVAATHIAGSRRLAWCPRFARFLALTWARLVLADEIDKLGVLNIPSLRAASPLQPFLLLTSFFKSLITNLGHLEGGPRLVLAYLNLTENPVTALRCGFYPQVIHTNRSQGSASPKGGGVGSNSETTAIEGLM